MEEKVCDRSGCSNSFIPKTHNNKYCGRECQRIETNRKIMVKYYQKRDRKSGKKRYCTVCETTQLSRYNDDTVCGSCSLKAAEESRNNLVSILTAISA